MLYNRHRENKLTFDGVGGEESQVLGFQRVVVGALGGAGLRLGLSRQRRVVNLINTARTY